MVCVWVQICKYAAMQDADTHTKCQLEKWKEVFAGKIIGMASNLGTPNTYSCLRRASPKHHNWHIAAKG